MIAQRQAPRTHAMTSPSAARGVARSRGPAPRRTPILAPRADDPLATMLARAVRERDVPLAPAGTLARAPFKAGDFKRPNFSTSTYRMAVDAHNLFRGGDIDPYDPELSRRNMAVPHRFSWKSMRDNTLAYLNRDETTADFRRWTDRMLFDGYDGKRKQLWALLRQLKKKRDKRIENYGEDDDRVEALNVKITACKSIIVHMARQQRDCRDARRELITAVNEYWAAFDDDDPISRATAKTAGATFLKHMNNFYPNVSDLGPHRGVNIQVRERMHLNVETSGSMSPFSMEMTAMSPHRSDGIAVDDEDRIVGTYGTLVKQKRLSKPLRKAVSAHGTYQVNYRDPVFDPT